MTDKSDDLKARLREDHYDDRDGCRVHKGFDELCRERRQSADRIADLEALLRDLQDDLRMSATVTLADPHIIVDLCAMCERHGYGNVMASASALWRQRLGKQAGGEFVAGPCRATVEGHNRRIDAYFASKEGEA